MSDENAPVDSGLNGDNVGGTANLVNTDVGSSFSIPEEYADRSWKEKIKSHEDLFKAYDNAQSLLGKRVAPSEDAAPEEWEQFYKTIGKPESADAYKLPDVDGLPEDVDLSEFQGKARQIMHEAGLTQKQAEKLYQLYLKEEMNTANANKEAIANRQAELDKEFEDITAKVFEGKFEEISAKAQSFIKNNLPADLIPVAQELADQPKAFAAMIALADRAQKQISDIKAKYGAEDNLNSGGQAQGVDKDAVLKQLTEAKVRAKNADPFSPDRKKAENEIQELRGRLQSFYK